MCFCCCLTILDTPSLQVPGFLFVSLKFSGARRKPEETSLVYKQDDAALTFIILIQGYKCAAFLIVTLTGR